MATLNSTVERKFQEAIQKSIFVDYDEILDFINDWLDPEDVFSKDVLKEWALNNGFFQEGYGDDPREEAYTAAERNPSLCGR